ncbi:ABC transporter substrate-binding protein [uncultured Arcticibacterium sp.]|uniref:ABC transporter substrate-binding protein n=1 Tax=uncultured Arcticibacterium sp. TaxID=2173042 RepID=UPI0030F6F27C
MLLNLKRIPKRHLSLILVLLTGVLLGCKTPKVEEINIGAILPLSGRATDLGIGPSKALQLAVEQYNDIRASDEPLVNLYIEDDQWEKEKALPAYRKLKAEHDIDVLFISNTDGTVAVQEQILEDNVLVVNSLNNDATLSKLNKNTFKIAKSTEEANLVVGVRIIELGLKNVAILHYPNDFMTTASRAVSELLSDRDVKNKVITVEAEQTDFKEILRNLKSEEVDAYVFFGYKEFGYAMKEARDMGITAPFYGSTTLLDPEFFDNSNGAIISTECPFFMEADGNYVLAHQFMKDFEAKYDKEPFSVWPPMQAYDAMNLVLNEIKKVNTENDNKELFVDWLRRRLYGVRYYQGICGNLSITEDGSSRGIYFSLYRMKEKGRLLKVKR